MLVGPRVVKKGWGREVIWADTADYCGKLLEFEMGKRFSMHFHSKKEETWYVLSGQFIVEYIDTETATKFEQALIAGDAWHNKPNSPHRIVCIRAGTIVEVSTADSIMDNYRVLPGDSQHEIYS